MEKLKSRPATSVSALLVVALVIAALARLVPVAVDTPIGRDITEYQNVAENLAEHQWFGLDIKAFHAYESSAVHYAGYARPPLLPVVLWLAEMIAPADLVARLIGPLLYLGSLILAWSLLRGCFSPIASFWTVVLLAVHPGLWRVSLLPLTEPLVLVLVLLALWACLRRSAPLISGLAVALAFLARPGTAVIGVVIGVIWAAQAWRERRMAGVIVFCMAALFGPAALIAGNLANGVPPLLTAQGFLWRVVRFDEAVFYLHRNPIYDSTAALLADQGVGSILHVIAKNIYFYGLALGKASDGLAMILPLLPLAWMGLRKSSRVAFAVALGAIAFVDLSLYCAAWATFDAGRFLTFTRFFAIMLIVPPAFEAIAAMAAGRGLAASAASASSSALSSPATPVGGSRLAQAVMAVIALTWLCSIGMRSYVTVREHQTGRYPAGGLARLWFTPDTDALHASFEKAFSKSPGERPPTVASNEPWFTNRELRVPSFVIPHDLYAEEWIEFLTTRGADAVLIHEDAWPVDYSANLAALRAALADGGWRVVHEKSPLQLWAAPEGTNGSL